MPDISRPVMVWTKMKLIYQFGVLISIALIGLSAVAVTAGFPINRFLAVDWTKQPAKPVLEKQITRSRPYFFPPGGPFDNKAKFLGDHFFIKI